MVPSGSCGGMLKHHYPKLFADQPEAAEAQRFSSRVFELTEFLVTGARIKLGRPGPTDQSHLAFLL
jgi:L-lactate dehydrogenase complex protein LldE